MPRVHTSGSALTTVPKTVKHPGPTARPKPEVLRWTLRPFRSLNLCTFILLLACAISAPAQYDEVFRKVQTMVEAQRSQHAIPLIAVALVDGQHTVFTGISGSANSETLYRAGSVSKLFTAIAVMQQVEKGVLDLDKPVSQYLPDFQPRNSFGKPITLRHLLSHRSGLGREPPAGHYFDPSYHTLAATVRSLNQTELVYEPGRHTKYSNAAIAAAGRVLEHVTGIPFARLLQDSVLTPLGMRHSGFVLPADMAPRLARAFLWTYDGRQFDAPRFDLGIAPAGNLYTTPSDLGLFLSALFRDGAPLLSPATLRKMYDPQFGGSYGLGFALAKLDGQRAISHDGAIYGFSTALRAIPGDKLGAVVIANLDSTNPVTSRISQLALHWMRQTRRGLPLDDPPQTTALTPAESSSYAGRYGEGEQAIELTARAGRLYLTPLRGGPVQELRSGAENDLIADGRLGYGLRLIPRPDALQDGPTLLTRRPDLRPAPCPPEWRSYLGEYGWDHDVLYVLEREGKLTVLIEWYDYYPLEQVSPGVFRFPGWGLYDGETLTFTWQGARVGGVLFPKRPSPENGYFRITPVKPVEALREAALSAAPPPEKGPFRPPELIELRTLDRTIKLDIRYANSTNFLGVPLYTQARAFLQRPAAEALLRAHRELSKHGLGLLIHDAYRPWYVTKIFWDATPEDKHIFVADPSKGSRHNRGCAVDLTLYDLKTGKPLEMTGGYDEMSERSYPDYPGGASLARFNRELLRRAMEAQGFRVYDAEWWHFDYKDSEKYGIQNIKFESLSKGIN